MWDVWKKDQFQYSTHAYWFIRISICMILTFWIISFAHRNRKLLHFSHSPSPKAEKKRIQLKRKENENTKRERVREQKRISNKIRSETVTILSVFTYCCYKWKVWGWKYGRKKAKILFSMDQKYVHNKRHKKEKKKKEKRPQDQRIDAYIHVIYFRNYAHYTPWYSIYRTKWQGIESPTTKNR